MRGEISTQILSAAKFIENAWPLSQPMGRWHPVQFNKAKEGVEFSGYNHAHIVMHGHMSGLLDSCIVLVKIVNISEFL